MVQIINGIIAGRGRLPDGVYGWDVPLNLVGVAIYGYNRLLPVL